MIAYLLIKHHNFYGTFFKKLKVLEQENAFLNLLEQQGQKYEKPFMMIGQLQLQKERSAGGNS